MAIKKVTVAGGGVLGSQIAFQSAYCGFDVVVWVRSDASIERAKPKLERLLGIYTKTLEAMKTNPMAYCRGLAAADATPDQLDELKERAAQAAQSIEFTTDFAKAADCDLLIEAVAEDPAQKIEFYKTLAPYLSGDTIVVTNSSTLLPSTFAEYTGRPEKFLALHFANEIWKNNTGEVMGHAGTSQEAYDQIVQFAADIAMVPLPVKKEQPGYILNSLSVPFLNSALAIYADGVAEPEIIDKTWQLGTGAPLGPFRFIDIIGLDTVYNIASMHPAAKDPNSLQFKIVEKVKAYLDEGKTGVNAGEGFYSYK